MIGRNLSKVDAAGQYPRPKPGGYVIRITNVQNNVKNERIEIEFDIAEGEFAGYYKGLQERAKFWGGKFYKSYKENAQPFLKQFIELILECNPGTDGLVVGDWEDIDETRLVGKAIGMVVGEKEYMGNDGRVKTKLDTYNAEFTTVDAIRAGEFEVPAFKPLQEQDQPMPGSGNVVDTTAGFGPVSDNDMPF